MQPSRVPESRTLVVLLHAMGWKKDKGLAEVIQETRYSISGVEIFAPRLTTDWWSNASPSSLVEEVLSGIDKCVEARGAFDKIILVGYSVGGLLIRAAYVDAWATRRSWVGRVERLILLAAMNRGWTFAPTVNAFVDLIRRALYYVCRAVGGARLLSSTRRGSPFVTDLRLRWLDLITSEQRARDATVVQILGTIDDVVSPDDNIDIFSGYDFIYLDVPGSGHFNVVRFSAPEYGEKRRNTYRAALKATREELNARSSPVVHGIEVDPAINDVLFVVHGIRDYGFWTAHLARSVVAEAKGADLNMVYLTPTYGYFGLLPFLLPWNRLEKVRWFMDQYVEARALYPNARISYIGHSNGTYLLARALRDYSTPRLHRVVFAGSVVRSDYNWSTYVPDRIGRVLNYVATSDWVVGIFPRFLGRLGPVRSFFDLGGAGFDGFTPTPLDPNASVNDIECIVGSHSAALREFNWQFIADFVVHDKVPQRIEEIPNTRKTHSLLVRALAFGAPAIWLLLLSIVLLPIFLFFVARSTGVSLDLPGAEWALLFLLWFLLMRTILLRA